MIAELTPLLDRQEVEADFRIIASLRNAILSAVWEVP